jgi:hypothetical protein
MPSSDSSRFRNILFAVIKNLLDVQKWHENEESGEWAWAEGGALGWEKGCCCSLESSYGIRKEYNIPLILSSWGPLR